MERYRAVVFDMDGLLIDTEPIWRRSEVEVFGRVGLHLTEDQCLETMGVRISEVVDLWYSRHPWTGASRTDVTRWIEESVTSHITAEGVPMPGVHDALRSARSQGLSTAIASSSTLTMIRATVARLGISNSIDVVCSGADEREGKPHPAVYLTAARLLQVPPESCVALEDSPNGVLSAKSAGMTCIVVPDPHLADDPRIDQADLRLPSLEAFTPELLRSLQEGRAFPPT